MGKRLFRFMLWYYRLGLPHWFYPIYQGDGKTWHWFGFEIVVKGAMVGDTLFSAIDRQVKIRRQVEVE